MGLVKNRCKNGDHYWVSAYVTPIAKNGSIVQYQSVRTKPEPEQVLAAEKLYAQLRSGKAARPKLAASFSVNTCSMGVVLYQAQWLPACLLIHQ
ncbi:hypothetical protein [Klebsiella pneumoniae]|uniref:hypothetical protein n=1 Tax=Klebsiella pneumoniae TaxID=573 RepID=UPI003AB0A354